MNTSPTASQKRARVLGSITVASTLWLVIPFVLSPSLQPAHAYLDPGTGSYIIQVTIGVLFGGAYAVKRFVGTAFTAFKKRRADSKKEL